MEEGKTFCIFQGNNLNVWTSNIPGFLKFEFLDSTTIYLTITGAIIRYQIREYDDLTWLVLVLSSTTSLGYLKSYNS